MNDVLYLKGPGHRMLAYERAKLNLSNMYQNIMREASVRMDDGMIENGMHTFEDSYNIVEKILFDMYDKGDISMVKYMNETKWLDTIHKRVMERFGKTTHMWGGRRRQLMKKKSSPRKPKVDPIAMRMKMQEERAENMLLELRARGILIPSEYTGDIGLLDSVARRGTGRYMHGKKRHRAKRQTMLDKAVKYVKIPRNRF
jgi:hypothetical protein